MRRMVVVTVTCLVTTACGGSKHPVLRAIAYTKFLRGGSYEIWIAEPGGGERRRLGSGRSPAISPDGRWVAFQGSCDTSGDCRDLFLVASSGGEPRLLLREASTAAWAASSEQLLVYRTESLTAGRLLVLDRDGGGHVEVARGNLEGWSLSPAGGEVAFALNHRGTDIYAARTDGRDRKQLTHDGRSADPVWGDEGIAFTRRVRDSNIPRHGWGADEVWRMDADGTNRRPMSGPPPRRLLGSGITGFIPIAWRDGAVLAGLANEFGAPPYAVDPRGNRVRKIGRFGFRAWPDGLSKDGRSVLVETGNVELDRYQHIEVIPFRGGRGRVIARYAGEASWNL